MDKLLETLARLLGMGYSVVSDDGLVNQRCYTYKDAQQWMTSGLPGSTVRCAKHTYWSGPKLIESFRRI